MLTATWEAGTIIIVIELMRKGKRREVMQLARGHKATKWNRKDPQAHAPNHGILDKSICNSVIFLSYIFFITLEVVVT